MSEYMHLQEREYGHKCYKCRTKVGDSEYREIREPELVIVWVMSKERVLKMVIMMGRNMNGGVDEGETL